MKCYQREYKVEEMYNFQLVDSNLVDKDILIVHTDSRKPYYVYELCQYYHSAKCNECANLYNAYLLQNKANSASQSKSFKKMQGIKKKKFNDNEIQKIIEMSKSGKSNRKIAKEFHCCEKTIRNYLKEYKI